MIISRIISESRKCAADSNNRRTCVSLSTHGSVQFIFNCINLFQREKIVDSAATMMGGREIN